MQLIVGHSHGFDAPYRRARELIASGVYGRVHMITALNFTDFLYRPRRRRNSTRRGAAVSYSARARTRSTSCGCSPAATCARCARRPARGILPGPTEGAYSALLTFADGAFASLIYSGYAHFDSDEFCGWIGETGQPKDPARYGAARALTGRPLPREEEAALKFSRSYGSATQTPVAPVAHNHFGLVIASCERADLRPGPNGVIVCADNMQEFEAVAPPTVPRAEVLDELCDAVAGVRPPTHTGQWGQATLEVCLAILASARDGGEITLTRQLGEAT